MISGFKRFLIPAAAILAVVTLTGISGAQTRTINTSGTSTGGGTVKITIEDFNKPERRDLGTLSETSAAVTIEVTIGTGWDCAQTTQAIFEALLKALPDGYVLYVTTRDPCTIVIACKKGETCEGWVFSEFVDTVPGQTIVPGEPGVPVERTTWGGIKARNVWGAPSIRQN